MDALKKCIIIFSGYNQRAVFAFIRSLEKTGTPYGVISCPPFDTINVTKYASKVVATRRKAKLELLDLIDSIKEFQKEINASQYIIAPTSEALNRFILTHRDEFQKHKSFIPLVDKTLYEKISDKDTFIQICANEGIKTPKEFAGVENLEFPFVIKPKKYFSKNKETFKPFLIYDKNDLEKIKHLDPKDFLIQEYVEGKSIYLLFYFFKDGSVLKFSQENIAQQSDGKSIVAATASSYHLNKETEKFEALFKSLRYHGLVMIEVRVNKKGCYMIEANPRFWGPSQLFVDAGVDLFQAFLFDNGVIASKPVPPENIHKTLYCWFGGIISELNQGKKLKFYNKNQSDFFLNINNWLKSDIYCRQDTIEVFKRELQCPEQKN